MGGDRDCGEVGGLDMPSSEPSLKRLCISIAGLLIINVWRCGWVSPDGGSRSAKLEECLRRSSHAPSTWALWKYPDARPAA